MLSGEATLARGAAGPAGTWHGRRPPVRRLAEALLRDDLPDATSLTRCFLARVGSRAAVFADLLQPAQYQVGELWYEGRASIEDEHRAAMLLARLVAELPPTPAPGRSGVPAGSRCLLAVPPGEAHTLGLTMLALALEDEGWEVELADPEGDLADLAWLVDRARPRVVGVSAACPPPVPALAAAVAAIRGQGVPVLVGGAAFHRTGDLWRRVGASACGADARIGAVLARRFAHP